MALEFSKTAGRAGEQARRMQKVLLDMGVKPAHVKVAIERSEMTGESLPVIMRDFGFMGPEEVAEAVSVQFQMEYFAPMRMSQLETPEMALTPMAVYRPYVPAGFETDANGNQRLRVLVADEAGINDANNDFLDYRKRLLVASEQTIQTIFRRFYAKTADEYDVASNELLSVLNSRTREEDPGMLRNLFGRLLRHACYIGASDIYMSKSQAVGVIKLKVNGSGQIFRTVPFEVYDRLLNLLIQETGTKIEDLRREPREAYFSFNTEDFRRQFSDIAYRYGFRVELAESRDGNRTTVIRVQDGQSSLVSLNNLGFTDATKKRLKRWIGVSTGLIIVTGPTGSGKTTTLYALLGAIDPVERSIQSIENPIEVPKGLWQQYQPVTEPGQEADGAKKYLKAMLRQAPDVILMGETRDAESAAVLLDAAHTGHLAVSTLHTNSAVKALIRLRLLGVDGESLSAALQGILAQRLVRKLCPHCSLEDTREDTMTVLKSAAYLPMVHTPRMQGEGCTHCDFTGLKGRAMVYETLDVTPQVRRLLERDAPLTEVMGAAFVPGETMWGCGLEMVATGEVSIEELRRNAECDDDLLETVRNAAAKLQQGG